MVGKAGFQVVPYVLAEVCSTAYSQPGRPDSKNPGPVL